MSKTPTIHIGCAGWTIPREFYENFSASGTHLERYSRVLRCAEINSCFYRPHRPQTWTRWKDSVPDDFLFSVKAPKAITHEAKLNCCRKDLISFLEQVSFLQEKLGPILFQLPPSLQFNENAASKFLSMLREMYSGKVVWEPRHESWFAAEADNLLDRFRIARVAADPACASTGGRPGGWNGLSYYRLHGSPRRYYSAYTSDFLGKLAGEILHKNTQGNQAWCIFDNTASGAAMPNALELEQIRADLQSPRT